MEDIHILVTSPPGEAVVHHLPCKINMDGPAKISTYFVPEENKDGKYNTVPFDNNFDVMLRGHCPALRLLMIYAFLFLCSLFII